GVRTRRVFGDVHHLETVVHAERHGVFCTLLQVIHRPVFSITADWARTDEAAAFDRQADALRDVDDRLHIAHDRARGAVRPYLQLRVDDLAREPLDVTHDLGAGAGEADVRRVDANLVEEPQDAELLVN